MAGSGGAEGALRLAPSSCTAGSRGARPGQGCGARSRSPPHSTCFSHPKQSSHHHHRDKYLRPGTGLGGGGGGCTSRVGDFSVSKPRSARGWEAFGEEPGGEASGAAGPGAHFSAKVTSESHSHPMQGESGPSSASVGTPPLPRSLDSAQPQGSSPPAPPAGLCPCPQLRLRPLLQASAGTAEGRVRSEGSQLLCQVGSQRGALQPVLTPRLALPRPPPRQHAGASSAPPPLYSHPLLVPPWPTCWLPGLLRL